MVVLPIILFIITGKYDNVQKIITAYKQKSHYTLIPRMNLKIKY